MDSYVYLAHHGTKGMKWGERKYQNPDGSLTPLGRVHYGVGKAREGVGKAVSSIAKTVRKKVAPTNAELNAQIRRQKSKNLNKEKRRQLKELKKGTNADAVSSSDRNRLKGQHKRFSEMSDDEIKSRINRLESEIKLADLERTKNMGPGMRLVDSALKEVAKESIKKLVTKAITDAGSKAIDGWLKDSDDKTQNNTKKYENELKERKAKEELATYKKEHPEGLSKLSPSNRKAVRDAKERKKQEEADKKLKEESDRSAKRSTITKETAKRVQALNDAGLTNAEIAKRAGISIGDVDYYIKYKTG